MRQAPCAIRQGPPDSTHTISSMGIAGLPDARNPLQPNQIDGIRQCGHWPIRQCCRIPRIPLSANEFQQIRQSGHLGIAGSIAGFPAGPLATTRGVSS